MATKTTSKKATEDKKVGDDATGKIHELLGTMNKTGHSALDAMHRFADSINDSFPDVGEDGDGPRSKIIAAAFKLTGDIVDAGHRMAASVVDVSSDAVTDVAKTAGAQAG